MNRAGIGRDQAAEPTGDGLRRDEQRGSGNGLILCIEQRCADMPVAIEGRDEMPQVGRSAIRMEQVIEPVANRVRTDIERCAKLRLHRIGGVPTHQHAAARQAGQQHQADQSDQAYAKRHDTFPLHCAPSHCTGQQFRETFSRKTGTCAIASPGSRRPNPTSSRATEGSWRASRADHRGGHDPCVRRRDRTDGDADATAGHGTASRRGGRRVPTDRLRGRSQHRSRRRPRCWTAPTSGARGRPT